VIAGIGSRKCVGFGGAAAAAAGSNVAHAEIPAAPRETVFGNSIRCRLLEPSKGRGRGGDDRRWVINNSINDSSDRRST